MHFVTEHHGTLLGIALGHFIFDRPGSLVALFAVVGDPEGCLAVMTGATRLPLFHVRHRGMPVPRPGDVKFVMAINARIGSKMKLVTENCSRLLIRDLLDRVAFRAVLFDSKGTFAVMAGATGLPFGHHIHGVAFSRRP